MRWRYFVKKLALVQEATPYRDTFISKAKGRLVVWGDTPNLVPKPDRLKRVFFRSNSLKTSYFRGNAAQNSRLDTTFNILLAEGAKELFV